MSKLKFIFICLFLAFVLVGCQNNNLEFTEDGVNNLEVYEWESNEHVTTMTDKNFIEELVNELDNARTASTADIDIVNPDYKLIFKNDEEPIFEIGYYNQVMNFNLEGKFHSFGESLMYGVELPLPFD